MSAVTANVELQQQIRESQQCRLGAISFVRISKGKGRRRVTVRCDWLASEQRFIFDDLARKLSTSCSVKVEQSTGSFTDIGFIVVGREERETLHLFALWRASVVEFFPIKTAVTVPDDTVTPEPSAEKLVLTPRRATREPERSVRPAPQQRPIQQQSVPQRSVPQLMFRAP